jgi:NAD-dependent SIR2 family protein deacetylase
MKKCSCGHTFKTVEKYYIGRMDNLKLYNCPKCKSTVSKKVGKDG